MRADIKEPGHREEKRVRSARRNQRDLVSIDSWSYQDQASTDTFLSRH